MQKSKLFEIVIALLAMLFLFTGTSKLLKFASFKFGLQLQPLPVWLTDLLTFTLPGLELATAFGLFFNKTRMPALVLYTLTMAGYTTYTGLIVFNYFSAEPCGCGGIIKGLTWQTHFILNLFITAIAVLTFIHTRKRIIYNQEVS